jgi:hypothetical protein
MSIHRLGGVADRECRGMPENGRPQFSDGRRLATPINSLKWIRFDERATAPQNLNPSSLRLNADNQQPIRLAANKREIVAGVRRDACRRLS